MTIWKQNEIKASKEHKKSELINSLCFIGTLMVMFSTLFIL